MTNNRSLQISYEMKETLSENLLPVLSDMIPDSLRKGARASTARSRVFGHWETLQTMVLTATQKDKSLKNSVCLFYTAHEERKKLLEKELSELNESDRIAAEAGTKKPGRSGTRERQFPKTKRPVNFVEYGRIQCGAQKTARRADPGAVYKQCDSEIAGMVIPIFMT